MTPQNSEPDRVRVGMRFRDESGHMVEMERESIVPGTWEPAWLCMSDKATFPIIADADLHTDGRPRRSGWSLMP